MEESRKAGCGGAGRKELNHREQHVWQSISASGSAGMAFVLCPGLGSLGTTSPIDSPFEMSCI